jgi:3'-phosphoadenosine 5'-phosphosulfate sulfotransferase (PAPS reductase)/FAD synthetase
MAEESRPIVDPDALVAAAKDRWSPLRTFCLFSGGTDSGVLAHRLRDSYDDLLYIDTGTAIPGVEAHIRDFARRLDKPLWIRRSGDAYRTMVLGDRLWWSRYRATAVRRRRPFSIEEMLAEDRRGGEVISARKFGEAPYGFPGKGQHSKAYARLKERRIKDVLREVKVGQPRDSRVLFLSGIRRDESARRSTREPMSERGSAKFCNPLIAWTRSEVDDYHAQHQLPVSDVAALMHRSGECNCGAFAQAEEERRLIASLWPTWWSRSIGRLESEAMRLGIRWCRWGGYDLDGVQAAGAPGRPGLLCSTCESRSFEDDGTVGGTADEAPPAARPQAHPRARRTRTGRAPIRRCSAECRGGEKLRSSRHLEDRS